MHLALCSQAATRGHFHRYHSPVTICESHTHTLEDRHFIVSLTENIFIETTMQGDKNISNQKSELRLVVRLKGLSEGSSALTWKSVDRSSPRMGF